MAAPTKKKKIKRTLLEAQVHIFSSFNNTIVTVTDMRGEALAWSSAGGLGFKGAKKSTPYAAQKTAETVMEKVKDFGIRDVHVFVKGPWCRTRVCHSFCRCYRSFYQKYFRCNPYST